MDYHGRIMNLKLEKYWEVPIEDDFSYKMGHRDARHTAAEIAIEADRKIKELEAKIEQYAEQLDKANGAMSKWPPAMGRNGRMNVGELVKMLVAEIERKDEALKYILSHRGDEPIGETDIFEMIDSLNIPRVSSEEE